MMKNILFWSKEHDQKNKFPTVELQNSTYLIYLKISNKKRKETTFKLIIII